MKIYDAIALFRQECPVGVSLEECIIAKAVDGNVIALRLLDAEEVFLPTDQRTFKQLRNPRYLRITDDLPEGVTGIVTDGISEWRTDSKRPFDFNTLYFRKLP